MTLCTNKDIAPLVPEGIARVLKQVHERVQEMAALHEHGRKLGLVITVDSDRVTRCSRKDLGDGLIKFINQIEPLHVAFAQLCVSHDLRNDSVRMLDFLDRKSTRLNSSHA